MNCEAQNKKYLKDKYVPPNFVEKEIALYAPTFGDGASYFRRGDEILLALAQKDVFVIVKPHPNCLGVPVGRSNENLKDFMQRNFPRGNYVVITSTPYEVMAISDFIISDFSSISFEYSLLRRPIHLFVGENPHVADPGQLDALKNCSFVFGEKEPIDPAFFSNRCIDHGRIKAMQNLEGLYFANYGSATDVAMNLLIDKKVILSQQK